MTAVGWAAMAIVLACAVLGVGLTTAWSLKRQRSTAARLAALTALEARTNDRYTALARSVSESNHVLANAAMAAMLQLELLERRLRGPDDAETDLSRNAARVMQDLRRCHDLVNDVKGALVAATPVLPPLDWRPVVERACARHRASLSIVDDVAHPVMLEGGAGRLEGLLEALLLNAWEGNGEHRARAVEVEVRGAGLDARDVLLVVRDDGPGFAPEALPLLPKPLWSTKGRPGLSLFEAARVAVASGGWLRLANGVSGGARVELGLRVVVPARAE